MNLSEVLQVKHKHVYKCQRTSGGNNTPNKLISLAIRTFSLVACR